MPINRLLAEPSRFLTWLESAEGKAYNELINEWYKAETKKERSSDEQRDIFRAQGALHYLEQILGLRATIREYQRDVAAGKRKKITLEEVESHGLVG